MASLLGAQYDSSSDDDMGTAAAQSNPTPAIVAAPDVPVEVWSPLVILLDLSLKEIVYCLAPLLTFSIGSFTVAPNAEKTNRYGTDI